MPKGKNMFAKIQPFSAKTHEYVFRCFLIIKILIKGFAHPLSQYGGCGKDFSVINHH